MIARSREEGWGNERSEAAGRASYYAYLEASGLFDAYLQRRKLITS